MLLRLLPQWRSTLPRLDSLRRIPLRSHPRPPLAEYSTIQTSHLPPNPQDETDTSSNPDSTQPDWKRERNRKYRAAFDETSSVVQAHTPEMLRSPFVPSVRKYPSDVLSWQSEKQVQTAARTLSGYKVLWERHRSSRPFPTFEQTFDLLKRMTTELDGDEKIYALQIRLPSSLDFTFASEGINFVDSVTGLLSRLRVLPHHQDASTIILRGQNTVLKHAADEFIKAFKGIEVFELGDVAALDYETKQIWPSVEISPEGVPNLSTAPTDKLYSITIEKDAAVEWIERPFEEIAKPTKWTKESFEAYMSKLVNSQLPSHLALKFYRDDDKHDRQLVDVTKTKASLIHEAIVNPDARGCITPGTFNKALSFLAHAGGHITKAMEVFAYAEETGIPLDTTSFNIMLSAHISRRNVAQLQVFLNKMQSSWFRPDAHTWLLFLSAVKKDDVRRQVMAAMYQNRYFQDVATKRGIARINAPSDAYQSFSQGKPMAGFLADQKKRYGEHWFSFRSCSDIVGEYLAFNSREPDSVRFADVELLLHKTPWDASKPSIEVYNTILRHAALMSDQSLALWALSKAHSHQCELTSASYDSLVKLFYSSHAPHAISVVFFYAVLCRKLRRSGRKNMLSLFGRSPAHFWGRNRPRVFTQQMRRVFKDFTLTNTRLSRIEWIMLSHCEELVPAQPLHEILQQVVERDVPFQATGRSKINRVAPVVSAVEIPVVNTSTKQHHTIVLDRYIDLSSEPQFVNRKAQSVKQEGAKDSPSSTGTSGQTSRRKGPQSREEDPARFRTGGGQGMEDFFRAREERRRRVPPVASAKA